MQPSATRIWLASIAAFVAGAVVLLVYALSEVLAHPGISLVDGYWIGRVPWTPMGVGLAFVGGNGTLIFASLTVWLAGSWALRSLTVPGLVTAAWWWFITLVFHVPAGVGACCVRPQPEFDLITSVYSSPEGPILLILLPAAVASVLGLTALRGERAPSSSPG